MAGQGGGGSGGTLSDRRLHYQATLGFHAPYITGVTGQFSGTDIEQTFRAAVLSVRELMRRKLIPPSLLTELLGKGPGEALIVDTVDKAGRWDIQVIGFEQKPITRIMFCKACENNQAWKYDHEASDNAVYT
jgi:hypothetical protein